MDYSPNPQLDRNFDPSEARRLTRRSFFVGAAALAGMTTSHYVKKHRRENLALALVYLSIMRNSLDNGQLYSAEDLGLKENTSKTVSELLIKNLNNPPSTDRGTYSWLDDACILRNLNYNLFNEFFADEQETIVEDLLQESDLLFNELTMSMLTENSDYQELKDSLLPEVRKIYDDLIETKIKISGLFAGIPASLLHSKLISMTEKQQNAASSILNSHDITIRTQAAEGLKKLARQIAAEAIPPLLDPSIPTATLIHESDHFKINQLRNLMIKDTSWGFKGTVSYNFEQQNENWRLKLIPLTYDFLVVFQDKDQPEKVITRTLGDFIESAEKGELNKLREQASLYYQKEQNTAPILNAFNFPEEASISYLRFFPLRRDLVISSCIFASSVFSSALENRYPGQVQTTAMSFSDSLLEKLEKQVADSVANGCSHIFADIYHHGFEAGGLAFKDTTDIKQFTTALIKLVEKYPETEFCYSTIACYGGGLRTEFEKQLKEIPESIRKRISLFLGTQPDQPNLVNLFRGTSFLYLLSNELNQSHNITYGQAFNNAARQLKIMDAMDANGIVHGKSFAQLKKLHSTLC